MEIKLIDTIAYPETLKVQYVEVANLTICNVLSGSFKELYEKIATLRGEDKSYSMWCIKFVNCVINIHVNTEGFKDCRFENCEFENINHASFDRCSFSKNTKGDFKFCTLDNCRFENDNLFNFQFCELLNIKGIDDEISMYQCTLDDKAISDEIVFDETKISKEKA